MKLFFTSLLLLISLTAALANPSTWLVGRWQGDAALARQENNDPAAAERIAVMGNIYMEFTPTRYITGVLLPAGDGVEADSVDVGIYKVKSARPDTITIEIQSESGESEEIVVECIDRDHIRLPDAKDGSLYLKRIEALPDAIREAARARSRELPMPTAPAALSPRPTGDAIQDAILGTWVLSDGTASTRLVFEADGTVSLGTDTARSRGRFRLNTMTQPVELDLLDMRRAGTDAPEQVAGIVEFTGPDTLRICAERLPAGARDAASRRPREFADSDATLVFTREKKALPPPGARSAAPPRAGEPADFSGAWRFNFEFMRNTRNPDEGMHNWFGFDVQLTQDGDTVTGRMSGGQVSGVIRARAAGDGLVGTMRLSWDNHDWQVLALRMPAGAWEGEGIAIFAPRPEGDDERHIYFIKAVRRTEGAAR